MTEESTVDAPEPPVDVAALSPDALQQTLAAGDPVRLLDVRDRDEIEAWRIDGPKVTRTHIPYSKFLQATVTDNVGDLAEDVSGDGTITVVCGHGEASDYVAALLEDAGVPAQNLAGGMRGWARLYRSRAIHRDDTTVLQYQRPSSGCLTYAVCSGDEAVVIDPLRAFTERYLADIAERDATLVTAIDTHIHADHVSGIRSLAAESGATVRLPAASVDRGLAYDVEPIDAGEAITVGETDLEAVSLPGHTTDMTGFAIEDVLLTGDSVFLDGVARPDLQQGAAEPAELAGDLYDTVCKRLADRAGETLVAPGHYEPETEAAANGTYTRTLGALRGELPAFELSCSAFVERLLADLPPRPANDERIVAINRGESAVEAETAFELELGPNNCAASPTDPD